MLGASSDAVNATGSANTVGGAHFPVRPLDCPHLPFPDFRDRAVVEKRNGRDYRANTVSTLNRKHNLVISPHKK